LQVRIDRRAEAFRIALSATSPEDPPLHAVRIALVAVVAADDLVQLRRWTSVVASTPSVLRGVVGGIYLKIQQVLADFFGARLGQPSDAMIPRVLAAATGGVVQAVQTQWFLNGGDLVSMASEALAVLEGGIGTDSPKWSGEGAPRAVPAPTVDREQSASPVAL
jgi:TetR/AcrR family transcriptional regulator, regulator of mycofactocin system